MDPSRYSSYAHRLAAAFSADPGLAEAFRKEIYFALTDRALSHKKLKEKIAAALRDPEARSEVDDVLALYDGPSGMLVLFMGEDEAAERVKRTGKDDRQLDIEGAIAEAEREQAGSPLDRAISKFDAIGGKVEDLYEVVAGERKQLFEIADEAEDDGTPPSVEHIDRAVAHLFAVMSDWHTPASEARARQLLARRSDQQVLVISGFYLHLGTLAPEARAAVRPPSSVASFATDFFSNDPDAGPSPEPDGWLDEPLRLDADMPVESLKDAAEKG